MLLLGVRGFVPNKFVFGVLDYLFAVGVQGFGVGVCVFWAKDEFWGQIVTDSSSFVLFGYLPIVYEGLGL